MMTYRKKEEMDPATYFKSTVGLQFCKFIRGKEYRETFHTFMKTIEHKELKKPMAENEFIQLYYYMLIVEAYDRLECLEEKLKNG